MRRRDGNDWTSNLDDLEMDDDVEELTETDSPIDSDEKPQ
jgi:hypothetical protein